MKAVPSSTGVPSLYTTFTDALTTFLDDVDAAKGFSPAGVAGAAAGLFCAASLVVALATSLETPSLSVATVFAAAVPSAAEVSSAITCHGIMVSIRIAVSNTPETFAFNSFFFVTITFLS